MSPLVRLRNPIPARVPTSVSKHLNSFFPLCNSLRLLSQLHSQILLHGLHLSPFFGSKLATSYSNSHSLPNARKVFDQIPKKNPHSWNTMLSLYSKARHFSGLLHLYSLSRAQNHKPDNFSLVFAIRACTHLSLLHPGTSLHSEAIRSGLESHDHVAASLINMYLELGSLETAEKVFDRATTNANPAVWALMMKAYSRKSMSIQVFGLFQQMKELACELDPCVAVCLAGACANFGAAREGRSIHGFCLKTNWLDSNVYLQASLFDMYVKSGFIDFAERLFDEMTTKDVPGLAQSGIALHISRTVGRICGAEESHNCERSICLCTHGSIATS